ncbi:MAG: type III pantothenate kinase [Alphaproteobacteria bacterium]|nr:type III pantothenate kinase [Alphaproteobacteria bacterium]
MLLAVDTGNTNTVFAVYRQDTLLNSWRLRTVPGRSADEYAAFLNQVFDLAGIAWNEVGDIIISSVVPETNFHLSAFCSKYLGREPLFVTKDLVDIALDITRPEDVGADRLVNAVAVQAYYTMPAIVIDFGTATTFDIIDAQGRYAGGVIAPGINLSVSALHKAAAKLPSVSIRRPEHVIGKDTVSAMQSGVYWGYRGLIEGLISGITAEMGIKPLIIATGGLAPLFAKDMPIINHVDDELTLKGLLVIYKSKKL